MRKKILTLMLGTLLLLTACGQTGNSSASTMLPVAAVQSATAAIAPVDDKVEETLSTPAGEEQPDVPEQPTTPEQPVTPALVPVPAPTLAEELEQTVPEVTPEPAPKPIASGNIYSIAEAIQAGNEYARAQNGVTIDTSMTAADSSYFPGTADSVAWLAENGGQAALTAAVRGNVDATFACLAAMDGAETVSAYARFNCTARYDAASDEYIVVVLYG